MMELWEDLKRYFYRSVLEQRKAQLAPHRIVNFESAKSVAILYDSTNPDNDITITKFAELLRGRGKQVEVFAYLHDKKIDHKADVKIFNRNSVNWYGVPTDEKVKDFCRKNFDLLFCAFNNDSPPLEYVAAFSHAAYRVGPFMPEKTVCFDLMIETGAKKDLTYLLQRMLATLESIRSN